METISINGNTLINILIQQFRLSINEIVNAIPDSNSFISSLSLFLGNIKNYKNWHQICTAMDLLEDTQCAKENYMRFEIEGPTRYNDLGEKYLRLYGILNALYLQRSALIEISRYSNNGNIRLLKDKIDSCKAIKIRHAAGSHNLLCNGDNSKKIYMTSQMDLRNGCIGLMDNNNEYTVEDLKDGIVEFDNVISHELYNCTRRVFLKIPNNRENKILVREYLKHINNFLNGKMYFSFRDEYSFNVGM